jgi:hypothetical protein
MGDARSLGASFFVPHWSRPFRSDNPSLCSGKILSCGLHACPSKCHQNSDHSKIRCGHRMDSTCPAAGHRQQWQCHKGPPLTCVKCERDKAITEKKKQEEFALQQKRDEDQRKHAQRIAEIEDQIAQTWITLRDTQVAEEWSVPPLTAFQSHMFNSIDSGA